MTLKGVSSACMYGRHRACHGESGEWGVPCGCGCHAAQSADGILCALKRSLAAMRQNGTPEGVVAYIGAVRDAQLDKLRAAGEPIPPTIREMDAAADSVTARFLADLLAEYTSARATHGNYASHHEAYAVLLEEVQEYWAHVTRKPAERDAAAMYRELVQVAQVAMAAAVLLLPPEGASGDDGKERDG